MQYLCGSRSYYHRRNFLEPAVVPPQIFGFFLCSFFLMKCFPNSKQRLHTIICMKINMYDEKKKELTKVGKRAILSKWEKIKIWKFVCSSFKNSAISKKLHRWKYLRKSNPTFFIVLHAGAKKQNEATVNQSMDHRSENRWQC